MTKLFPTVGKFLTTAAFAALAVAAPAVAAGEHSEKGLNPKTLAALEDSAKTEGDYREIAERYERRAELLEEKAARHDRLQQRYSTIPASLIAKRGYSWDTPRRQRDLAAKARREAAEARQLAEDFSKRAQSATSEVD